MFNAIGFKSGGLLWITPDEKTLINHAILNGESFVEILRLSKTFNTAEFSFVGVPHFFSYEEVRNITGDSFGFTDNMVFACGKKYWKYLYAEGMWVESSKIEFENSSDFEGYVKDYERKN